MFSVNLCTRTARVFLLALLLPRPLLAASVAQPPPLPAPTGAVINVSSEAQLQAAVASAPSGSTIVIAPGTYALSGPLYLVNTTDVTIRGATNNRDDVVLAGRGMTNPAVQFGIWSNGIRTTIANLTIRDIYYHPIILNAGAAAPRIYNVHLINAGQQFIKSNPDGSGGGVNNGIVEYSVLEYETTSLDYYTNGVDVHSGSGWIVRNNLFRNITAPAGQLAGPAVLMWNHSLNSIVEGNTFINCQRDISMGLLERVPADHVGGIVRNNFIYHRPGFSGDVPILVADSANTQVLHNTVLVNGSYPSAVEYRFAGTTGTIITNNLFDAAISARDGASGAVANNSVSATAAMFVNPAAGDLHLLSSAVAAIDRVAVLANAPQDFDGDGRPQGSLAEYGADEYVPPAGSAPTSPSTLAAATPAAGQVTLTWIDTSSNETRFEIASDDTLAVRQSAAANSIAATFTGLSTTTAYRWYVRACNAAGCSSWIGPVARTADGSSVPPTAPAGLTAASPAAGQINLGWSDTSANESRFDVAYDDALVVRQSQAVNATTATFTGLSATTAYHWYVRACNAAGCSSWIGPVAQMASGPAAGSRTVSGAVMLNGSALGGVAVTATNGVTCTTTTAAGQYNCTVPQGWSGSVTPALSSYTFSPISRSYTNTAADQTQQNYAATMASGGTETVWVDDAVPAGGVALGGGDSWLWVSANPLPFAGTQAHQSAVASGLHQHYFYNASAQLPIATGDKLFAYVYLDPANPPSEVMLQWNDGDWGYRAYWGANLIDWGTDGTASRRYMGALPATGQWVRLEIGADVLGLAGHTLNGMAFTLFNGRATWDKAGKQAPGSALTYQVSGTVSLNGTGLIGVTMAATNGVSCTTTNAAGQYSCTAPQGWSGSVTPALTGYTFAPVSRSYSNVAADQTLQTYTATAVAPTTYQVSGTVTLNGSGLNGVAMAATNGVTCTTTTASGQYSCTVPQGWTGSVTPALSGYTFAPASRSYTNVAVNQTLQNYTASLITLQVSGTVTLNGSGLSGVTLTATNGVTCTTTTATGQYSCTVPQGWSGSVTPAISGYTLAPASRSFTNVAADQTLQNYAASVVVVPTFQVSGTVTLNGSALNGVAVTATNGVPCTTTTAAGQYSCTVPQGWTGSVTPALSGYTFAPASRSYTNVAANQTLQNYTATAASGGAETVWVDEAVPAGAAAVGDGDTWSWVSANPAPYAGTRAHQSALVSGVHQHYFYNAGATLAIAAGDKLFTYVYLDPANPPSEVMLQWNDGEWNYRAYWGANVIGWGADGTASRRYMGALPATGQWIRLEVAADLLGLVGHTLNGMAFTLFNGRATWDKAGKQAAGSAATFQVSGTVTLNGSGLNVVALAATNGVSCTTTAGAGQYSCTVPQGWTGSVTPTLSGYTFAPASRSYSNVAADQTLQNYSASLVVVPTYQVSGTVTLNGSGLNGVALTATNGVSCTATAGAGQYSCTVPLGWSGSVTPTLSGYAFAPASRSYSNVAADQTLQTFAATVASGGAETVWVDDAVPAGATALGGGDNWLWVTSNPLPYSGTQAHQSALVSGLHQHYFYNASAQLPIAAGDKLFAYVYLDPANPPSELMLQWSDGDWGYRAYWGANVIDWGTDGTASRRYMGALPATGQWARLEVGADVLGLAGHTLNGMAFTLFNGRATWDKAGKQAAGSAVTYQVSGSVTLNGSGLNGVTLTATNGVSCTTTAGAGQYSCTVPQGWTGSVTPALSNYTFTPASRTYTNVAANQTLQNYAASLGAPVTSTAARANSYDNGWEASWVEHARQLLATAAGKTDGFVLQIGDSMTYSFAYAMWAKEGQGQTVRDAQTAAWARAASYSTAPSDFTNKNGWYQATAGKTAYSGLSAAEYLSGCCNGGPTMPATTNVATAQQILADPSYTGNRQIDTVIAPFADAQFAVVMLGSNAPDDPNGAASLAAILDKLEAQHIVPVLSTIPPRNDAVSNDLNVQFNAAIRSLAQARSLPLIDFYQEVLLRRPGTTWAGTLISADGVHPTGDNAGFTVTSNPYLPGGDPATQTSGDALLNSGYLLRSWLTIQKLSEVKSYVIDGVNP